MLVRDISQVRAFMHVDISVPKQESSGQLSIYLSRDKAHRQTERGLDDGFGLQSIVLMPLQERHHIVGWNEAGLLICFFCFASLTV